LIGGLVALDRWHSRRDPRVVGLAEAAGWSIFYVVIALLFGVAFAVISGWDAGAQYFAGYVVGRSLSLDNLFVFVIIMSTFAVQPRSICGPTAVHLFRRRAREPAVAHNPVVAAARRHGLS
jgi:tellurite resistance protein TerC